MRFSDDIKAQRILELFGFNFKRNGVLYLLKAIIASPKYLYFNLETLSESVSKTEGIDKEEVKRLIIARIKETFGFRKAPTVDFIRLVNNFFSKTRGGLTMKKITFKVSSQTEVSVVSLIKEVNKMPCRICLNIENGYVTVENADNTMIDAIIELVDNYYTILGVDIDNTFEETTALQIAPVVAESSANTIDEAVEGHVAADDTDIKVSKTKPLIKKVSEEEAALLETIGFAFDKLDTSKMVEEQVDSFLTDIGMTTTERMVTQSFIIACNINKINYENVLLGLHDEFPKVKKAIIKNILTEAFNNWLEKYPNLAEKCPKISLMTVLKVFAKKFAQTQIC